MPTDDRPRYEITPALIRKMKHAMVDLGLNQKKLAAQSQLSNATVSDIMRAKQRTSADLLTLLDVLRIPQWEAFPLSACQKRLLNAFATMERCHSRAQLDDTLDDMDRRASDSAPGEPQSPDSSSGRKGRTDASIEDEKTLLAAARARRARKHKRAASTH